MVFNEKKNIVRIYILEFFISPDLQDINEASRQMLQKAFIVKPQKVTNEESFKISFFEAFPGTFSGTFFRDVYFKNFGVTDLI